MKRIISTLALISAVLVIGCNDSSPVAPEAIQQPDGAAKAIVPSLLPNKGKIAFDGTVQLSITTSNSTPDLGFVSGSAKYAVSISPILVKDYLAVGLSMRAEVKSKSGTGNTWFFSGESNDLVVAPVAGTPAYIIKSYEAQNPTDPVPAYTMKLNIKYMILSGTVSVQSVWVVPGIDQF